MACPQCSPSLTRSSSAKGTSGRRWVDRFTCTLHMKYLQNPDLRDSIFVSDFFESTTERRLKLPLCIKTTSFVLLNMVTPTIVVLAILMWELIDLLQVVTVLKFILCLLSFVFCFYLNYFTIYIFINIFIYFCSTHSQNSKKET